MVEIEKMKMEDMVSPPWNPREITSEDMEKLERSLNEFGYIDPIIVNRHNNHIVGGNQRYTALKKLGYTEVDVIFVNIPDINKEKQLNVALNKISGEWENEKLHQVLTDIKLSGLDVTLTGFDEIELDDLDLEFMDEPEIVEDDFEPPEEDEIETDIKKGDVFQLGTHRLMCGDSTSTEDMEILMADMRADLVFTDPPWNVNYGVNLAKNNPQGYKVRTIENDHMETEEFKEFITSAFKNMNQFSKPGCMTYVVMSAQEWGSLMLALREADYHWSSTIIWNKDRLVLSRKDYHTKYEPIYYGWKEGAPRLKPLDDRKQSDVWDIERPHVSEEHPTMKPIELVARAITNSSNPSDVVLDLFGGSGSTLIASEQTDRQCMMMELEPKYCQVIIDRWEEFTGETAVKIN